MIGTVHLLTGANIGRWAGEHLRKRSHAAAVVLVIPIVSHFLQDALPHTEPHNLPGSLEHLLSPQGLALLGDAGLGTLLFGYLLYAYPRLRSFTVLFAAVWACVPDFVTTIPLTKGLFDQIPGVGTFNDLHKAGHGWWRLWLGEKQALNMSGWILGTFNNVLFVYLAFRALKRNQQQTASMTAQQVEFV